VVLRLVVMMGLTVLFGLVILVRPLSEQADVPPDTGPPDAPATSEPEALASDPSPAPTEEGPAPMPTPTGTSTPVPIPTSSPATTALAPTATTAPATAASAPNPSPSPQPLVGRVAQGSYVSQVTGRQEPYRVYLPPGYDQQDRRYPVLYLLHGWPYDEAHWDMLGVDETADRMMVQGMLQPFIVVLPGAGDLYVTTSGGAYSFEQQLVNELMPHIDATFRTLQTREARAIGGISRGGVWALEIAFRHADAFGAAGAHSPALAANRAPPAYDPFFLLTEPGVAGLRIYLSAGDADWARQATAELHQALSRHGITSQLAIHEGAHVDSLWARHIEEYLAFYAAGW
jgi:enterochelin esterase-like enzyme